MKFYISGTIGPSEVDLAIDVDDIPQDIIRAILLAGFMSYSTMPLTELLPTAEIVSKNFLESLGYESTENT